MAKTGTPFLKAILGTRGSKSDSAKSGRIVSQIPVTRDKWSFPRMIKLAQRQADAGQSIEWPLFANNMPSILCNRG
jgi:hypothetical protein